MKDDKNIHIHIYEGRGGKRPVVDINEIEGYCEPNNWQNRMFRFENAEKNLGQKVQKAWSKFLQLVKQKESPGTTVKIISFLIVLTVIASLGFLSYLTIPNVQLWIDSKLSGSTTVSFPTTHECIWSVDMIPATGLPNFLENGRYIGPLIENYPVRICKDEDFDDWLKLELPGKIDGNTVNNGQALATAICLESRGAEGCIAKVYESLLFSLGSNYFILPDRSLGFINDPAETKPKDQETELVQVTPYQETTPTVPSAQSEESVISIGNLQSFMAEGNYTFTLATTKCPLEDQIPMRVQRLDGSFEEVVVDVSNIRHNFVEEACNIEWSGVVFTKLQPLEAYPDQVPELKWWSYYEPGNLWVWPFSIECPTFSWEDLLSVQITGVFKLASNLRWESEDSCFYLIDPPKTLPISGWHAKWEMDPGRTHLAPDWVTGGYQFTKEAREADIYGETFEVKVPGADLYAYPVLPLPLEQSTPWAP